MPSGGKQLGNIFFGEKYVFKECCHLFVGRSEQIFFEALLCRVPRWREIHKGRDHRPLSFSCTEVATPIKFYWRACLRDMEGFLVKRTPPNQTIGQMIYTKNNLGREFIKLWYEESAQSDNDIKCPSDWEACDWNTKIKIFQDTRMHLTHLFNIFIGAIARRKF